MKLHGNGSGRTGKSGRSSRLFFSPVAVFVIGFLLGPAWAHADDEEYNFSWLDPEKKIYVLQNRRYQKAGHALFSAMLGVGWSNAYRSTLNFDPRLAYYFSETMGVEFFYEIVSNSENNTYEALKNTHTTLMPNIREITAQTGVLFHWAPWYAKINVFNEILYFDWYLEGGAGNIQSRVDTQTIAGQPARYSTESLFGLYLGTGHQYHLSQRWVVRLDVLGSFYSAPVFGTSGEKRLFSNYNFTAGVGFRL